MNDRPSLPALSPSTVEHQVAEAVEIMPFGVALFDAEQRAVLINHAYCDTMAMPSGCFPPGTPLADVLRVGAHRGMLGPGDPEQELRVALAADRSRPMRLRRRMFDNRSFDIQLAPIPGGGHVVCAVEVTSLVAARNDAEAGARRIANVVSTLRTGLAAFAPDRTMLLHNARFAELIGVPLSTLREGMALGELLDRMREADEYASIDGSIFVSQQAALDRSRPHQGRRVRSDGCVVDIASDPLPDGGWTMTVADITPLARAEDDSRRRARILDGIVDNIPHGIAVYGPDLRVTMINPAYHAIMPAEALKVGDHLDDMVRERTGSGDLGPEEAALFLSSRREAIRKPTQWRRSRPSGISLDVRTAPLPDGGHMSVITDVTLQVRAEADAKRRAAELDAMLASTRHGIAMFDSGLKLIAGNRAAAELMEVPHGAEPAEALQVNLSAMRELQLLEGARADVWLRRFTTASGRKLEVRSDPGPDDGCVLTYTDITPFLDAEQALRDARDAAEAASRAKSRFLATMSHELRTPLSAVIGFSETLMGQAGAAVLPSSVDEFAHLINDAGHQLLRLVNNVLDVARLEPDRIGLLREPVAIDELIEAALTQIASAASTADVSVTLFQSRTGIVVAADRARLAEALGQLLSNAVKFSTAGGRAWIEAGRLSSGDVYLRVNDTGIGVSEGDLERVFEPFTQVDSGLERRFPGAGLGLYIARTLIEAHGGKLLLHPRLDGGTTAELTLPASRVENIRQSTDHKEPA